VAASDPFEEDDKLWKVAPEYKAFHDELTQVLNSLEARQAQGEGADSCMGSNEVAFLIAYMQNPHPRARAEAVVAAGGIWRSDPAKATLLPHVTSLLSDPVWQVRMWAANTLGEIGDKDMIPHLKPLLQDRPEVARTTQRAINRLEQL